MERTFETERKAHDETLKLVGRLLDRLGSHARRMEEGVELNDRHLDLTIAHVKEASAAAAVDPEAPTS